MQVWNSQRWSQATHIFYPSELQPDATRVHDAAYYIIKLHSRLFFSFDDGKLTVVIKFLRKVLEFSGVRSFSSLFDIADHGPSGKMSGVWTYSKTL